MMTTTDQDQMIGYLRSQGFTDWHVETMLEKIESGEFMPLKKPDGSWMFAVAPHVVDEIVERVDSALRHPSQHVRDAAQSFVDEVEKRNLQ